MKQPEKDKPQSWGARLRAASTRARQFLSGDLWNADLGDLPGPLGFLFRTLRVGLLVAKGFRDDDLTVRAAALTFTSLMSLVPLLAVGFALFKGFGVGEEEIDRIIQWTGTMPEQFQGFLEQIMELAQRTSFAALGWMGLGVLLATAVALFGSVEISFNRVWGISAPRPLLRRAANFISILVVVPILIGFAGTAAATLKSEALIARLGAVGLLYRTLLGWSPFFLGFLAFTFLYLFLPNTRVRIVPAVVSGLAGSALWLGWQTAYINMQVGVARYNAIYGTFASIPIFLFWMYVSWVIVLLGAEVTFAVQHHNTLHLEQMGEKASPLSRTLLALAILAAASRNQLEGDGVFDATHFARSRKAPVRLVNELMELIAERGWMAPLDSAPGSYALLVAPDRLPVGDVIRLVMEEGSSAESLGLDRLTGESTVVAGLFEKGLTAAGADRSLRQLVEGGS